MKKIAIAVHGGAGDLSSYIKKHTLEVEAGLKKALQKGQQILKRGGTSTRAVEEAVKILEDNPIFNAGRGSVLNAAGEVEMDAAIMDGRTLKAGAVAMVRHVKNPVALAKTIMTKTKHVFLSGYGAVDIAKHYSLALEPESYFITDHQYEEFQQRNSKSSHKTRHGTVGAVALDDKGNLAAATSTGGISYSLPGRIGDSCIVGAGCYANNKTCAVSGTGIGEYLIRNVVAHTISMLMELKKCSLQEACNYVIFKRNQFSQSDMGVIAVDSKGHVGMAFNTKIMSRAWIDKNGEIIVKI